MQRTRIMADNNGRDSIAANFDVVALRARCTGYRRHILDLSPSATTIHISDMFRALN